MSVEQAIHEQWAAYRPLDDLLSADSKLFTGSAVGDPDYPYVTLERQGTPESKRTSEGKVIEATLLRIHMWDSDLDRAKKIAAVAFDKFNRADFAYSQGYVIDGKQVNQVEVQDDSLVWHVWRDWIFRTVQTAGA